MNTKFKIIICVLLLMFSLVCDRESETKKVVKDDSYFPLAIGNYWMYRKYPGYGMFGYDVEMIKIVDTVRVNDTLFYRLSHPLSRKVKDVFLYKDLEGDIWYKDSLSGALSLYEKNLTKNLDYIYLFEGKDSVGINFVSEDIIEVPAGVFKCVKFKVTFLNDTLTPPFYKWYSKGVGLIKIESEETDSVKVYQLLIEAKVNGIKYPPFLGFANDKGRIKNVHSIWRIKRFIINIFILFLIIFSSFFAKRHLKTKPVLYSFLIWFLGTVLYIVSGYFIVVSKLSTFLGEKGTIYLMLIISSMFGGYMLERKGWIIGLLIGAPFALFYVTEIVYSHSLLAILTLFLSLLIIGILGGIGGAFTVNRIKNKE